MFRNYHIMVFSFFIAFGCSSTKNNELNEFEIAIRGQENKEFLNSFSTSYYNVLKDSIVKAGNNVFTLDSADDKVIIKSIIANQNKDSIYVIAINESHFTENYFNNDENDTEKCSFYSVLGIPIEIKNDNLNFNASQINVFKMINNCNDKETKTSMEEIENTYYSYVFDALKKTEEIEFPKDSGVLFLKALYTKYYKKNE